MGRGKCQGNGMLGGSIVTPARVGVRGLRSARSVGGYGGWIPVFTGMTGAGRNDGNRAGMGGVGGLPGESKCLAQRSMSFDSVALRMSGGGWLMRMWGVVD